VPPAQDDSAERIAFDAVSTWRRIDDALSPILGQRAVSMLYKRSLYLTRSKHPCLTALYEVTRAQGEFAPLQTALSSQSSVDAAAASTSLLQAFGELLTHLLGQSLGEQLLQSIHHPSDAKTVQDIQP